MLFSVPHSLGKRYDPDLRDDHGSEWCGQLHSHLRLRVLAVILRMLGVACIAIITACLLFGMVAVAASGPPLPVYGVGLLGVDGGIACVVYADGGKVSSNCLFQSTTDAGPPLLPDSGYAPGSITTAFIDAGCIKMNGVVRCSWETGQADVLLNVGGLGNVSGIYQTFFYPSICAAPWPTPPCLCGAGAYGYGTCPSDGGIPHGFLGVGPNDHCSASVLAVVNDGGLGYSSMLQASASPSDNDAGLVANGISVSFVNWTTTSFMPGSTNLLGEVQCTQSN